MKRIAAPQVGGVFSAMILTLFVIPSVYVMWRWWKERQENSVREKGHASLPEDNI